MFTISFEGFMELVEELLNDRDLLEEVYGSWATGQPIKLPYNVLKRFYFEYGNIHSSVDKFFRQLVKRKVAKINFIVGEFGAGKTQLLYYIKGLVEDKLDVKCLYFSLENMFPKSEKHVVMEIKEAVDKANKPVVILLDDLDFYFTFTDDPVGRINNFLNVIYNTFKERMGGKVRTIVVAMNSSYFNPLVKILSKRLHKGYSWKVIVDFNMSYDEFLEFSLDIGFKLLALQYVLNYYDNFQEKIRRGFDVIWEYLYHLTLRIAKFGIRTIGLYLKMVNDRLVDFIRFLRVDGGRHPNSEGLEKYVEVIDVYLKEKFNDIILTFDRIDTFKRYKIDYIEKRDGYQLGELHVKGLDETTGGRTVEGKIAVFYVNSFDVFDSIKVLQSGDSEAYDYYIVFQFIRKKRKIREEIEKVYLKIGEKMLKFSIVPLDINMLRFSMYLNREGYSIYMEKNTTSKKDLEEAVNIFANNKILELISSLPNEKQDCENLIQAIYLWSQTWILKSGLCRVRKRDLAIIRKFFNSLFPPRIYGLERERILDEIINTLNSKGVMRIRRNKLIINNSLDEDKILDEIITVAKERFC